MRPEPQGDLVLKAQVFAEIVYRDKAHEGIDLLTYVEECVEQVRDRGGSRDEIAAAYLRMSLRLGYAVPDDLLVPFGEKIVMIAQK